MDTRRTLEIVLIAFVASSVAQNFQSQPGGLQPQTSSVFHPQRVGPQDQQDDIFRATQFKPKRPPNFEQPGIRTAPQQPSHAQVQQNFVPFQSAPQPQSQPQTRTQNPVRHHSRPAVRQQQQQVQRQQFDQQQQQVQRQQFDQQQVQRQPIRTQLQAFEPSEVSRPQFDQQQQQVQRQQFEQQQVQQQRQQFAADQPTPTAQQVNQQHFFNAASQPIGEQSQEFQAPAVVRRPAAAVVRPAAAVVRTPTQQQPQQSEAELELLRQQAENARYSFAASVTDTINDQENLREETRDGLNLRGLYSYSDGYFKRTVHYEADQNGYRVIKEEVDEIGDGPKGDPNGRAEISSNVEGNPLSYSITAADIPTRTSLQSQTQHEHQPFATQTRGT